MKFRPLVAALAAVLVVAPPALAATYDVQFYEGARLYPDDTSPFPTLDVADFDGDGVPDGSGQFTFPGDVPAQGLFSTLNILGSFTVAGKTWEVTADNPNQPFKLAFVSGNADPYAAPYLVGIVYEQGTSGLGAPVAQALSLGALFVSSQNTVFSYWSINECTAQVCNGRYSGLYTLTKRPGPSVVPLPATVALLPLGLGALVLLRRRRASAA